MAQFPIRSASTRSCLLVSYAEIGVNSTEHVVAFARGLAVVGWRVHVATLMVDPPSISFRFHSFADNGEMHAVESEAGLGPVEVVHVWTPRGAIWHFLEKYSRLIGGALILHLEDDEGEVLKAFGPSGEDEEIWPHANALRRRRLDHLSHPILARCLASCSDGVTILSPELSSAVPFSNPCRRIVPPLGSRFISNRPRNSGADGEETVVFAGGVHAAVADDFHSLCRAVGLLVEKGRSIRLVRCGPRAMPPKLVEQGARLARNFHEAGYLSSEALAEVLASATVLVQPGGPTVFNRRRFPAKLAPYLASGTPVVMPACYDWIGVKHAEHAILFKTGEPAEIAEAIETVLDAPERSREMGKRAAQFAREEFGALRCARALDQFYRSVLAQPRRIAWSSIRRPRVELPLWLAAQPSLAGEELRRVSARFALQEKKRDPASGQQSAAPPGELPLVSVVVPNFNHRRFLPERFRSIWSQTHRNLEIIVLDDASTDGSLDDIRALQSPYPLKILANVTNSGSAFVQWQRGLAEARGEFVWIAESDDACAPDLIEKLLAVAARNPAIGIAYAQSRIIDESGRNLGSFRDYTDEIDREAWRQDYVNSGRDEAARHLAVRNTIPNASACLFRRSALLEADLSSITLKVCGDWLAYARICLRHDVAFVAEELNYFRRHSATARERANRTGAFSAEVYRVQNFIVEHFAVSAATRELGGRSSFRDLLQFLKNREKAGPLSDETALLAAATRFDPRFRERLAGDVIEQPPVVALRWQRSSADCTSEVCPYDVWRWTKVRFGAGAGRVTIVPISRPGLVALRRIRVLDSQNGSVVWSADSEEDYRRIEFDGTAHRLPSREALEVFSWGDTPRLLLPVPASVRSGENWVVEFEIRLAGLRAYDSPFSSQPTRRKSHALFIVPHLELGGADRCNLDLVGQLTRRFDWEVTIATTRRSADVWEPAFRALTEDVFMLPRFLPVARYAEFLAHLIETRRPAIVYLSHSEFGYRLLPWLRKAFPGLPVVDLLHLVMKDWKQGGYPRISSENRAWLAGTLVTSRWLKNEMVQRGCEEPRLQLVYTGIDATVWRRTAALAQAARARWGLPTDRAVILFAGRFAPQKNPELLLPVVQQLAARGRDFLLVLAGEGPQGAWVEKNLERMHPGSVRRLGPIAPADMPALLSATDLLLLPSQEEGIALVLFEAMSMAVVPVATDVGGQRELVTPDCGRLVTLGPALVESLVDALDALLLDPLGRAQTAERARARVEAHFALNQTGQVVDSFFRQCMQSGTVDWENLPVRPEIAPALLEDLDDIAVQSLAGDEWSRQVSEGKWLPAMVSKIAAMLRASPCGGAVRALERRYGERLGRWIVRRS